VRSRNLNNIKQHCVLDAVRHEGNCDSNICLMIRWCPSIGFITESSVMLLCKRYVMIWFDIEQWTSTNLKHFSYPPLTPHKDLFDIAWHGSRWRDIIPRATGLHQALEASIFYNIKWPHIFSNPMDNLCPVIQLEGFLQVISDWVRLTWSRSWYAVYVSRSLLPSPSLAQT
jgi:hypothetical protein